MADTLDRYHVQGDTKNGKTHAESYLDSLQAKQAFVRLVDTHYYEMVVMFTIVTDNRYHEFKRWTK